jgi:hypothetical protein
MTCAYLCLLLTYTQRITAADALKHPWLASEEPLPTSLDMMPRVKSRNQEKEEEELEKEKEKEKEKELDIEKE